MPQQPLPAAEPVSRDPGRRLSDWYETVAGRRTKESENQLLTRVLRHLFGYHLVVLGSQLPDESLSESPVAHRVYIAEHRRQGDRLDLQGCMHLLPLQNDSVDVLVLPHILEFSKQPHAILREVERVLRPDGHVVIFGFNPVSCFGVCRVLFGFTGKMPWKGHYYHPWRMRDWTKLLGFELVRIDYAVFAPPIQHNKILSLLSPMESLRKSWLLPLGGVYMMVAKKLAVRPNVIRPQWKAGTGLIKKGVAEPSGRIVNQRVTGKDSDK